MTDIGVSTPPSDQIPLRRRVLNAGAWVFSGYVLSQVIRFGSNLLLTRLLAPEMFGVMSIAMVVLIGLAMFTDLGLLQSVVRSERGDERLFLNTAWTIQILRGMLLCFFALVVSLLLVLANRFGISPRSSVYANPVLPYIVAVLSLNPLVDGFASIKLSKSRRHLKLGRLTQIEIAGQLVGLVCMFGWICFDRSIWPLAAGALGTSIARMVLSHVCLPGNPDRLQWDRRAVEEIVGFGKWIFLSSILGFLVANGDRILLGGLIDAEMLGIYAIAFTMFSTVVQTMESMSNVVFPALSEIARERRHDLKSGYYKFHAPVAAVAYLGSGVLMIAGHALIGILYDRRYAAGGWMLEVLAAGLLAVPTQIATSCYLALGLPKIYSKILVVRLIVLFISLPLGFHFFGMLGSILGVVASQLVVPILVFWWNIRLKLFDLRKELMFLPLIAVGCFIGKLVSMGIEHLHR